MSLLEAPFVPHILYTHWPYGSAPRSLQRCWRRLVALHPGWQIERLDAADLPEGLDHLDTEQRTTALALTALRRTGGVWLHGGMLAIQPAHHWVDGNAGDPTELWAFTAPHDDRLLEECAIACTADSAFMDAWYTECLRAWRMADDDAYRAAQRILLPEGTTAQLAAHVVRVRAATRFHPGTTGGEGEGGSGRPRGHLTILPAQSGPYALHEAMGWEAAAVAQFVAQEPCIQLARICGSLCMLWPEDWSRMARLALAPGSCLGRHPRMVPGEPVWGFVFGALALMLLIGGFMLAAFGGTAERSSIRSDIPSDIRRIQR